MPTSHSQPSFFGLLQYIAIMSLITVPSVACRSKEKVSPTDPKKLPKAPEKLPKAPNKLPMAPEAGTAKAPVLRVNDEKLADLWVDDSIDVLSISGLPPIDEWRTLVVRNIEGREFRASKPILLTGKRTMKLVRTPDKNYEFRVVESKGDSEFIRHRMPLVETIEIHKHGFTSPSAKPHTLRLTLHGQSKEVNDVMLGTIKKTPEPGGKKQRDSWLLLDFIGISTLSSNQSVFLRANDENIALSPQDFSSVEKKHFIRRNRRGQFHYRVWNTEQTSDVKVGELRNLTTLELR